MAGGEKPTGNNIDNGENNLEQVEQKDTLVSDSIKKSEERIQKLMKKAPDFQEAGEEELLELKSLQNAISKEKMEEGFSLTDEIRSIEKEFRKDLKGLKKISGLKGVNGKEKQEFITNINKDTFTETSEESIYNFFASNDVEDIQEYLINGGEFPQNDSELQGFFDNFEIRQGYQERFSIVSINLENIPDISKLSEVELKDIFKQIQEFDKLGFDFAKSGVSGKVITIKSNFNISKKSSDNLEKSKKDIEEKGQYIEEKGQDIEEKGQDIEEQELVDKGKSLELDRKLKSLKMFPGIYDVLKGFDEDSSVKIGETLSVLKSPQDARNLNKIDEALSFLENYFINQGNLERVLLEAEEKDMEDGNIGENSLTRKLRKQFSSINSNFKDEIDKIPEPFQDTIAGPSPIPTIINSFNGGEGDITKMGKDRYISGGNEFKFKDGELQVSSIDENGFTIEQGYIDVSGFKEISSDVSNEQKNLDGLKLNGKKLSDELISERLKKPVNEYKIQELEQNIEANRVLIEKSEKELVSLKKDLEEEQNKISGTISDKEKESVAKAKELIALTGFTKFFGKSFVNEFFARLKLSPTLATSLGLSRPVNLLEGIFGFDPALGESGQREAFGMMVNGMISKTKEGPLDIDAIKNGRLGYGDIKGGEGNIRNLMKMNVNSVGVPDVNIAFNNIKESQKTKIQE